MSRPTSLTVMVAAGWISTAGLVQAQPAFGALDPEIPKSNEGYRDAKWGMSPTEVRQQYPAAKGINGALIMLGEAEGRPAAIAFGFTHDRLSQVVVLFTEEYLSMGSYIDAQREMKSTLAETYGTPCLQFGWETQDSRITLGSRGESSKVSLAISYNSREFDGPLPRQADTLRPRRVETRECPRKAREILANPAAQSLAPRTQPPAGGSSWRLLGPAGRRPFLC